MAIGALVKTKVAPSSWALYATFQAIDWLFKAPNMIPRFPFNKSLDIPNYFGQN